MSGNPMRADPFGADLDLSDFKPAAKKPTDNSRGLGGRRFSEPGAGTCQARRPAPKAHGPQRSGQHQGDGGDGGAVPEASRAAIALVVNV